MATFSEVLEDIESGDITTTDAEFQLTRQAFLDITDQGPAYVPYFNISQFNFKCTLQQSINSSVTFEMVDFLTTDDWVVVNEET